MARSISRRCIAVFIFAGVLSAIFAQDAKPVCRIVPFGGDAMSQAELKTMERLVSSYVIELGIFRVVDSVGQEMALQEAETAIQMGSTKNIAVLSADYLLGGHVASLAESYVFTLEVTKVATGEKRTVLERGSAVNELVLKARTLTQSLFGRSDTRAPATDSVIVSPQATTSVTSASSAGNPAPQPIALANPALALVEGQWHGEKGIDKIRIFKDGSGLAFFSNGATMKIKTSIEGNSVIIAQNQPNSTNFYHSSGISYEIARKVALIARPVRWIMSLSSDKKTLFGRKETISVTVQAGEVSVDNTYIRESVWLRL